jgi:hypothetical protein
MVALHNGRLTARDIWPDNIWTWEDEARVQRQMEARLIDAGVAKGDIRFTFDLSNMMMSYRQRTSPGTLGDQQRVMARIYPPRPAAPRFTDEEIEAIMDRFAMANDDLGRQIHEKAAAMLGRDPQADETPGPGM